MKDEMNRLMKIGLLAALAFVLLGAYRYVSAQEEHSQAGKMPGPPPPAFNVSPSGGTDVAATKHPLVTTYYTSGTLNGAFIPPLTYAPVDAPQTISCPGTSGTCTIIADHWIELRNHGGVSGAGNLTQGCLYVDGIPANNCGFVEGEAPPDGSWFQSASSQAASGVVHGSHMVQTFAFCNGGCDVAYFQVNYRVYKP
jgi:hypothetical protein